MRESGNEEWADSRQYCSTEIHQTSKACVDCTGNGNCIECGEPIADGEAHKIRYEDGEVAHPGCV